MMTYPSDPRGHARTMLKVRILAGIAIFGAVVAFACVSYLIVNQLSNYTCQEVIK